MTERKPPGVGFESWIDRQIREAADRGDFDKLPGAGKPIPGQGQPDDEDWWIKNYLRREGLPTDTLLPLSLRLRAEVERLPSTVAVQRTEAQVRQAVESLNRRIKNWLLAPSEPRIHLLPVNVDRVVEQWRAARPPMSAEPTTEPAAAEPPGRPAAAEPAGEPARAEPPGEPTAAPQRAPWWRRWIGR